MASEGVGALNVKVMKFKQARVNGWSNYDSPRVAKCPHIPCQNWSGQGESDCLMQTKHCNCLREVLAQCDFCPVHCDGLRRCWRDVVSAQCIAMASEGVGAM